MGIPPTKFDKKEWPVLSAKAKTGKTKYWKIWVAITIAEWNGKIEWEDAYIMTEWWQDNDVHQTARKGPILGKNIGRSNETSYREQAISEAQSEWLQQKDKGYLEAGESPNKLPLPMLAHDYLKHAKKIKFPCYGQPKLDGIRCLYDGKQWWSRKGKLFIPKVLNHLHSDTKGLTFDGELMLPSHDYTFQELCSAVKAYDPEVSPQITYNTFDIVDPDKSFQERWKILTSFDEISKVPMYLIRSETELQQALQSEMSVGNEGLILRNIDGKYSINQRSYDLQKFKEFVDDEFQIIDVVEGEGKEKGAAIFECCLATKALVTFRVRPKGSYKQRSLWYQDRKNLIGKYLSVRYQNLTDSGLPRFPTGIAIRDYE